MLKELTKGPIIRISQLTNSIHISAINQLDQDLATYVNDYSELTWQWNQSFQIHNPESNYQSFFDVLKNVNTLSTTNWWI